MAESGPDAGDVADRDGARPSRDRGTLRADTLQPVSVSLGFNAQGVLLFDVNARQAGHQDPEIATYYANLHRELSEIPGVQSATLSRASIISAGTQLPITVARKEARGTRFLNVGPGFFTAMQIPMLLGREIDQRDRADTAGVVVVNERFATVNFGAGNPIGQHITLGGPHPRDMEIVGVSANVRYQGLKEEFTPIVFVAYTQGDWPPLEEMTFAMRTNGDPLSYATRVREIVRRADIRVPVTNLRTQSAEIDQTINREVVFARLCTAFAMLALIIASVGLYGYDGLWCCEAHGRDRHPIRTRRDSTCRRGAGAERCRRPGDWRTADRHSDRTRARHGFVDSFLFGLKPTDPAALLVAGRRAGSGGTVCRLHTRAARVTDRSDDCAQTRVTSHIHGVEKRHRLTYSYMGI